MRWSKVYALDVFEDSQEVARGLVVQAASGLNQLGNTAQATRWVSSGIR
jgi:hypothetical protein